ncbi:MAG: DUF2914 domain-containing protein [Myxococcales bacterium]|nr:DUF2914 domain-containing protein [Myxococcales bacterium]
MESPAATGLWERVQAFRERHAKAEIAVFFGAGFSVDVVTLDRIDSAFSITQQVVYMLALGLVLAQAYRVELGRSRPTGFFAKVWRFHQDAIHFLLGSLLSVFSLFYFKSASGLVSLAFMAAIFVVLVANELPRFRRLGHVVRIALYGFCVLSFFSYLAPTIAGFMSVWLFLAAAALSLGLGALLYRLVRPWSPDPRWAQRRVLLPYAAVHALALALYFARVVPPIPLYTQALGIYHDVKREGQDYRLFHQRPAWKIWQTGDQTFLARPGDRAYLFVRVWAPRGFKDVVKVRWARKDPERGWIEHKPYPLSFSGGRDQGFRTFAYTSDPRPGSWRVYVETDDERVIGTISFTVLEELQTEPRAFLEEPG